jgi:hypothetical protein
VGCAGHGLGMYLAVHGLDCARSVLVLGWPLALPDVVWAAHGLKISWAAYGLGWVRNRLGFALAKLFIGWAVLCMWRTQHGLGCTWDSQGMGLAWAGHVFGWVRTTVVSNRVSFSSHNETRPPVQFHRRVI